MSTKAKKEPTFSVKVRLPQSLRDKCEGLRESGPNCYQYESEFSGQSLYIPNKPVYVYLTNGVVDSWQY